MTEAQSVVFRHDHFPELGILLERIRSVYNPVDVVLFGSRAKGTNADDSDWDILVILQNDADERLLDPMIGWDVQADSGVHADVLCCYESEFLADIPVANSKSREIIDHAISIIPR